MAVLVVLSDPRPLEAVRTVLRRVCYLTDPAVYLTHQVLPLPWQNVFALGWSGVHGRIDKQEHAGRLMPGERDILLLGYDHALASAT